MAVDEYVTISVLGFADPVSSWTHLAGAVLALIIGIRLITRFRGLISTVRDWWFSSSPPYFFCR